MNKLQIAFVGFGEAGRTFARDLHALGGFALSAYDVAARDAGRRRDFEDKAAKIGVRLCESAAEAAAGAHVVFSAVTASSAHDVAREAGGYLKPDQFFVDINSVSPATKRADAQALTSCGARFVEAAVMAPVAPYGIRVPIVLGGSHAEDFAALLGSVMRLTVGEPEVGKASALKMCRSVMVKGLEALVVECFAAARLYGVEERVKASLAESYPGLDWERLVGYDLGRVIEHGRRRAAEMRESAQTVAETGLQPLMCAAIAERIDWVADLVQTEPRLLENRDETWRETLDQLSALAGLRPTKDLRP